MSLRLRSKFAINCGGVAHCFKYGVQLSQWHPIILQVAFSYCMRRQLTLYVQDYTWINIMW